MRRKIFGWLCIITAAAIFIYLGVTAGPHLLDYIKARKTYNNIQDEYTRPADPSEMPDNAFKSSGQSNTAEGIAETEQEGTEQDTEYDTDNGKMTEGQLLAMKYPPISVKSKELKEMNPDYAGWIYIPGTDISYPVANAGDNNTYLHKNINGSYSYAGAIFFDERNKDGEKEKHGILYGHNMRDGSMFAKIKNFAEQKYMDEHPVFWFITEDKAILYQNFAAYVAEPYDFDVTYSVENEEFSTDEEFDEILQKMKEKSVVKTDAEPKAEDQIMTLSTCTNARVTRFTVTGRDIYEIDLKKQKQSQTKKEN